MRTPTRTLCLGLSLCLVPELALGASGSLATVGGGATLGLAQKAYAGAPSRLGFTGELSLKARALHVLGLELTYAPFDRLEAADGEIYDSRLRLSLALHLIPTSPVGAYLKAGVGGSHVRDLVILGRTSRSYHAGGGLVIHTGDHLVWALEALYVIPGYETWDMGAGALETAEKSEDSNGRRTAALSMNDILGGSSLRAGLSLRYFF